MPRPSIRLLQCFSARPILTAFAVLMAAASTGCSPIISVHHAEVRGGSLSGLEMIVHLVIENENAFDVEIRSVRADVTLEGSYRLPPVDIQPGTWLRAGSRTQIAVPLTIPWSMVPALTAATAGSSAISYRIRGRADITAGRSAQVRRNSYPLDESGEIPRGRLANAGRGGIPFLP